MRASGGVALLLSLVVVTSGVVLANEDGGRGRAGQESKHVCAFGPGYWQNGTWTLYDKKCRLYDLLQVPPGTYFSRPFDKNVTVDATPAQHLPPHEVIEAIRGKSVWVAGDSRYVEAAVEIHRAFAGKYPRMPLDRAVCVPEQLKKYKCCITTVIPEIDFRIVVVFFVGLNEEAGNMDFGPYKGVGPQHSIRRLELYYRYLLTVKKYGPPALLVMGSNAWDLARTSEVWARDEDRTIGSKRFDFINGTYISEFWIPLARKWTDKALNLTLSSVNLPTLGAVRRLAGRGRLHVNEGNEQKRLLLLRQGAVKEDGQPEADRESSDEPIPVVWTTYCHVSRTKLSRVVDLVPEHHAALNVAARQIAMEYGLQVVDWEMMTTTMPHSVDYTRDGVHYYGQAAFQLYNLLLNAVAQYAMQ